MTHGNQAIIALLNSDRIGMEVKRMDTIPSAEDLQRDRDNLRTGLVSAIAMLSNTRPKLRTAKYRDELDGIMEMLVDEKMQVDIANDESGL